MTKKLTKEAREKGMQRIRDEVHACLDSVKYYPESVEVKGKNRIVILLTDESVEKAFRDEEDDKIIENGKVKK